MKYIAERPLSILEALALLSPGSSKASLRSWLKEGRVSVNGIAVTDGHTQLIPGETLAVGPKKKFIEGTLQILYEDRDLVVIDKPSGLLSVAAAYESGETAHAILKRHYRTNVYVVHRLDQETSGVMMFALHPDTFEKLKLLFETHEIERSYTGIVEGKMDSLSGSWRCFLYEDASYHVHASSDPSQGRLAVTHYHTLIASKHYSRLNFTLETGRKNQIRVQCQGAGHPIVGDKKYGAHSSPIKRLCLHAHLLGFKHPRTGKEMRFESPPPREFDQLIQNPLPHRL